MRVLVCGTNYGATYLRALYANESGFHLAGLLGRSERSRGLAAQCGVPFFTSVEDAAAIDAACVAIPGDAGRAVTTSLLERGIHVLAEHPVWPHDVVTHRATARAHRAVYHVNAHYSDIDAAATFVAAFRAARERSRVLFVNMMTNPRAVWSAIEIVMRALVPPASGGRAGTPVLQGGFFTIAEAIIDGVPVTIQMQRATSEVDDGSANWVSHNLVAGFEDGILTLGEAFGPVLWMPSAPSLPQLQSPGGMELWARPLWRVLASPPPTFGDYVGWGRERANRVALARFAGEIRAGVTPPEQSDEHLLGVSTLWESLLSPLPN